MFCFWWFLKRNGHFHNGLYLLFVVECLMFMEAIEVWKCHTRHSYSHRPNLYVCSHSGISFSFSIPFWGGACQLWSQKKNLAKKDLHQNNGWCLIYLLIIEFALNICNPLKPICIHPRFSWDAKLPLPLFTVSGITKPQTHCTSALNIPPAADYDPTSKFTLLNTTPWWDNTQELELAPKNGRY